MYDAIIVGARCGGSATGMLLARQGHSVLVVDRAEFPSDTWSTHFIHAAGTELLKRWGALDRLKALDVPIYDGITLNTESGQMSTADLFGPADVCSPRRTDLDLTLSELAAAAGAEVRLGVTATEVVRGDDGRLTGVRLRDAAGNVTEESARVVVGADGRTGIVGKSIDPPTRDAHEMHGAAVYAYFDDLDDAVEEVAFTDGTFLFIFPTKSRAACIGAAFNVEHEEAAKADPEGVFWRNIESVPGWADRVKRATRDGRWRLGELREGWFRHAGGAGWALVGDAACLKDPLAGHGITDSFLGAELLARAVDEAMAAGGAPSNFDAALARYDDALWRLLRPVYEATRDAATYNHSADQMLAKQAELGNKIGEEAAIVLAGGPTL
jgi:flavin-dependent dehydrogenase